MQNRLYHAHTELQIDYGLCYNPPMNPILRSASKSLILITLALLLWSGLVSPSAAQADAPPSACYTWTQVNAGGFGIGVGGGIKPFDGEEGFEVTVYDGRLYVGMEGDNSLGARLWRTTEPNTPPDSQADWEEVIADASGYPWGVTNLPQVDHIDSLAGFNGYLFASSANQSGHPRMESASFAARRAIRGTWEDALTSLGAGFGNTDNENFKDMQVFGDWLCGGTANLVNGAQVWCTQDGR